MQEKKNWLILSACRAGILADNQTPVGAALFLGMVQIGVTVFTFPGSTKSGQPHSERSPMSG
jgi:hypothetical protein